MDGILNLDLQRNIAYVSCVISFVMNYKTQQPYSSMRQWLQSSKYHQYSSRNHKHSVHFVLYNDVY